MAPTTLTQPDEPDRPDVVIGVDTPRGFHLTVALAPNGGRLGECSSPVNRRGSSDLQVWTLEHGSRPGFAIEGIGSSGAGLCGELMASGFPVMEVSRPDRSSRRCVGKDDAIDVESAVRAALREQLESLAHADLMTTCAAIQVAVMDCALAAAEKALRLLARRILTSSPCRPALACGRSVAASVSTEQPRCWWRWVITRSGSARMQPLLLSTSIAEATSRPMPPSTASLFCGWAGTTRPGFLQRGVWGRPQQG